MSGSKKCSVCQTNNIPEAKFCTSCGNKFEVATDLINTKENKCANCGEMNNQSAYYCINCGSKLVTKNSLKNPKKLRRKNQVNQPDQQVEKGKAYKFIYLPLFLGGIFFLYLVFQGPFSDQQSTGKNFNQTITLDNVLESQVIAVASKFRCACGSCGGTPLEDCSCESANAERSFIRENLKSGKTINEVIAAVNTNYGWLKEEFEAEYGIKN